MRDFFEVDGKSFNLNMVQDCFQEDDGSITIDGQEKHIVYRSNSEAAFSFYSWLIMNSRNHINNWKVSGSFFVLTSEYLSACYRNNTCPVITAVGTIEEALSILKEQPEDSYIVDVNLSKIYGIVAETREVIKYDQSSLF